MELIFECRNDIEITSIQQHRNKIDISMSNRYWDNLKQTTSKQGRLFNVVSILKLPQFNNIETRSTYQCRINIDITSNQQHRNKVDFSMSNQYWDNLKPTTLKQDRISMSNHHQIDSIQQCWNEVDTSMSIYSRNELDMSIIEPRSSFNIESISNKHRCINVVTTLIHQYRSDIDFRSTFFVLAGNILLKGKFYTICLHVWVCLKALCS